MVLVSSLLLHGLRDVCFPFALCCVHGVADFGHMSVLRPLFAQTKACIVQHKCFCRILRACLSDFFPSTCYESMFMRCSRYFLPVLKENPAEAQIASHRLMLRAGLIRQHVAGIYNWLPSGVACFAQD